MARSRRVAIEIATGCGLEAAAEDQATNRAHRIGQSRPVTVVRLVCKGTIEEAVLSLHNEKRALAPSLLAGGELAGSLSAAELAALVRRGKGEGSPTS